MTLSAIARFGAMRLAPAGASRLNTRARTASSTSGRAVHARQYVQAAIADEVEEEARVTAATPGKKRVVVLGSGWGAISFVKSLEQSAPYDVTLVSPRNYFLYTPLLPGAATGAVEDRSIVESIRRPIASKGYRYFEANALSVDPVRKTVRCRGSDHTFQDEDDLAKSQAWKEFDLEYDYLVTAVGAVPNTFGVPGVQEHCMFFKEIEHAARFRREVNERFECATLPGVPRERIQQLLKFVVIGAGPTGVELAAELYDYVYQDVAKTFPSRLLKDVSIEIIDLQEKILSTYDRRIAEYATEFFQRANIKCILGAAVKEVKDGAVVIADKDGSNQREVPFGIAVWCTGIKLNPFCEKLMDSLPEGAQENKRSLATDKNLRVKGSNGTIFALGDCATIERPRSLAKAEDLYREAARCTPDGDCEIDLSKEGVKKALRLGFDEFPHLEEICARIDEEFPKFTQGSDRMMYPEFRNMLEEVDKGLRALPATAQVAKQQGQYLASFFNESAADDERLQRGVARFDYVHKGSLAYVGKDAAVADIPGFGILKGIAAGLIWKSFETISQVSPRNVLLVAADMLRTKIFGRDISRLS
ncbi:Pyridine nucleotide-disulphide oxidoreductase,FAD/NAD(P)-binding domain [Ostreococcus tauri]|uniref:NADH:ubiquinone reductase (non-electrogenic) n=1 Tax=Ostreococcus tauri TaxID=70448 RepID=A0A090M7U1_OSTTA|nr:Pyridine nucleotide-disulphide oxidoreductase,FAD/NAD(P)-binding domain [Ostreococcus tauri]OUS42210.1 pyridine nucleotide-disulfide oxidoreductase-domain-containing protein [Ostreococcus tauri]CEG01132.1 Pyridine nucleotide-disulphide oxidoreductase,FAD/NAD(P)-binding domain [Ostreococcus tauri]|eukprot:XP_003075203.2 Pyridine nucleotide-disulphide oxidoreductase,FAD/NAD(P)-binding domain [Ostreococcus tauri]